VLLGGPDVAALPSPIWLDYGDGVYAGLLDVSGLRKLGVGLRLRVDHLEAIKKVAEHKGIPYQTLIQMWLVEKLRQEAPDLLHD